MFKQVLVGVDGKDSGEDAVMLAGKLLEPGGTLTLVHAYLGAYSTFPGVTPALVREERERAERELGELRDGVASDARVLVVDGVSAGKTLHEQAEAHGADLLVVGSCRRGRLGRTLLGDDTRAALNGAPCAVAIAPLGYRGNAAPFATIGIGYDGSPESETALAAARSLAAPNRARLQALNVVPLARSYYTGLVPPALLDMDDVVRRADAEMKKIDGVDGWAELGIAGEELTAFSKELDLLIVGSRGYGAIGRLVHGSTSNHLQRHARCPLLVLPRGGAERATKRVAAAAAGATADA